MLDMALAGYSMRKFRCLNDLSEELLGTEQIYLPNARVSYLYED